MQPMPTNNRRALLVEDEVLVAMVATDALGELGFDVVEATSAKSALTLAEADIDNFALAIVDLGLPDRPGEELVAELKAMRANLPIIVASGQSADGNARFETFTSLVILSKPYEFKSLRASIEALGLCPPAT